MRYEKLLTAWCDKLIELQVTQMKDKNFYGGILCPACASIHGRIADAVYPLICLYDRTKNEKYLNAALLAIEWSENNVKRPSGIYFNDKCASWKGTSAFTAMALGDTLLHHSDCLPTEVKRNFYIFMNGLPKRCMNILTILILILTSTTTWRKVP